MILKEIKLFWSVVYICEYQVGGVCVCVRTFQLNCRLVCVADSKVRLNGYESGASCRVCISLEGALKGLKPTIFTWRIRNLGKTRVRDVLILKNK